MRIFPKLVITSVTALACGAVATMWLPSAKADDQVAAAAAKGRELTTKELDAIYADRTWQWDDGAAYFRARNQMFTAWLNKGTKASYADGRWSVNDQGRLCFRATWYVIGGNSTTSTCFEHRSDDKAIYQRKLPDGQWYVFSHIPAASDDAVQKIQPGDRVSENLRQNKDYVGEHSSKRIGEHSSKRKRPR